MADGASVSTSQPARAGGSGGSSGRLGVNLVLAILFLLVALVASIVLLVAVGVVEPGQLAIGGWTAGEELLSRIGGAPLVRMLWAVGALVIGVLAVWALWGRLSSGGGGRRADSQSRYLLVADEEGFVLVETQSVAIVAKQAAYQVKGVVEADVRVIAAGGAAVRVGVELVVHPGADVKNAGAAVKDGVRDAVERLVGLDVQDVMVNVRVAEPDELAGILP